MTTRLSEAHRVSPGPSGPTGPTSVRRLLGPPPETALPWLSPDELIGLVEAAGLTGRGGAGFPTARKLRAVAGQRPVVVGNAMEGEPLAVKDAVLLTHSPGLVLDGLELLRRTLRARRAVLAVGEQVPSGPVRTVAAATPVEVLRLPGGFVAGQESALVNQVDGRPAVPSDPLMPVFRRGVDGRPTLVVNAETLAHLALLARYGAAWFRTQGTPEDPGTFLVSLSGRLPGADPAGDPVAAPGVLEAPRGATLRQLLTAGRTDLDRVQAVLVGGYHGAWVPAARIGTPMTRAALAPYDASPGAGVVHVLDTETCPLALTAEIADYLAAQSTRQCGPCVNGLPRIAGSLRRLAVPGSSHHLPGEIERLRGLVTGRGACAHPDGTARLVASTMRVFAVHVQEHLEGVCRADPRRLDAL